MKRFGLLAALLAATVFVLGCGGSLSVPGAVKVTEAEMKTKLVGSWKQESSELEVELRLTAEREGMLQTEQGKSNFEEKLKAAYRKYEFRSDGTYQKIQDKYFDFNVYGE